MFNLQDHRIWITQTNTACHSELIALLGKRRTLIESLTMWKHAFLLAFRLIYLLSFCHDPHRIYDVEGLVGKGGHNIVARCHFHKFLLTRSNVKSTFGSTKTKEKYFATYLKYLRNKTFRENSTGMIYDENSALV